MGVDLHLKVRIDQHSSTKVVQFFFLIFCSKLGEEQKKEKALYASLVWIFAQN